MKQKRRQIGLDRRKVQLPNRSETGSKPSEPDILDIWEQQRRMREREAQLEREYEAAKRHLKDVKLRMKQNEGLLADAALLDTSLREDLSQAVKGLWLWIKKSIKKLNLRAEILYIKLRLRLGVPLSGRTSLTRERFVLVVLVAVVTGSIIYLAKDSSRGSGAQAGLASGGQAQDGTIPLNQTPEFPVLSPGGQGASQLGGFAKVSPPDAAPTYAYVDRIEDVDIRVSQQQLPEALKEDAEFEKMANQYNAGRPLDTDIGPVYIGQSDKGPQSIIFKKDGLLILISSDGEIADSSWIEYMNNLAI